MWKMQEALGIKNGDKVRLTSDVVRLNLRLVFGTKVSKEVLDAGPLPGWKCKLADKCGA